MKIPPTVQAILAARIDRLPPDQKNLLQTLAVIGTEFKLGLVREVWQHHYNRGAEPELEPMLSELQLGEFIYEQPAVGDIEYTFKHTLTQNVAYHSMLNERRRLLHERIGTALESIYADNLRDHIAQLAYHYSRSDNAEKAVVYCLRAVRRLQDLGSNGEADAYFTSGLEQLWKLPDDDRRAELELDLRNAAFGALGDSLGYASPEAKQSIERAAMLYQRPGIDWEKTWSALSGIFFVHQLRPDVSKAEAIAADLIARAEEHASVSRLAESANWLAYAKMVSGDFESADQAFARAWTLLESMAKKAAGPAPQRAGQMPQVQTITQRMGTDKTTAFSQDGICGSSAILTALWSESVLPPPSRKSPGRQRISWRTFTDSPPTSMSSAANPSRCERGRKQGSSYRPNRATSVAVS